MSGVWLDCAGSFNSPCSGSSLSTVEIGLIFTAVAVVGMFCIFTFWWLIQKRGQITGPEYYRNFDKEDKVMDKYMQMTTQETGEDRQVICTATPDIEQLASENPAREYPPLKVGESSEIPNENKLQLENRGY